MKRLLAGIMVLIIAFTFVSLSASAAESKSKATIFFNPGPFIFEKLPVSTLESTS